MVEVTIGSTTKAHIPEENRFPIEWKSSALFYAYLTITDTGRGMTAKTIQRIFDPFFTDKFTGRGLGLPVTLGIVKSSNGCIVVTSEPGCGSVLNVYWPLYLNSFSPAKKEPAIESPIIIGAGTVLLVEDKKAVRNMAKAILERLGFEVYTANNGLEAVKRFRANLDRIILVITDLTMPHMNGWETLIALRRLKSDIPVILVSGYNEKQAMTLDHEEQPQAFLHKPYHIKTLKSAIQKALGNKSLTVKTGKSKKCGII
jgi:CheY-like chemotaxis protein